MKLESLSDRGSTNHSGWIDKFECIISSWNWFESIRINFEMIRLGSFVIVVIPGKMVALFLTIHSLASKDDSLSLSSTSLSSLVESIGKMLWRRFMLKGALLYTAPFVFSPCTEQGTRVSGGERGQTASPVPTRYGFSCRIISFPTGKGNEPSGWEKKKECAGWFSVGNWKPLSPCVSMARHVSTRSHFGGLN